MKTVKNDVFAVFHDKMRNFFIKIEQKQAADFSPKTKKKTATCPEKTYEKAIQNGKIDCQHRNAKKKQNKLHEKSCVIVLKSLNSTKGQGKVIDTFWLGWYNATRKFSKLFKASFANLQQ